MSSSTPPLSGTPNHLVNQALSLARMLDTLRLWAELTGTPDTGSDGGGEQAAHAVRTTRDIASNLRMCAASATTAEALLAPMLEAAERADALAQALDADSRRQGVRRPWQRVAAVLTHEPGNSLQRLIQQLPARRSVWQAALESEQTRQRVAEHMTDGEQIDDDSATIVAGMETPEAADEDDPRPWAGEPQATYAEVAEPAARAAELGARERERWML